MALKRKPFYRDNQIVRMLLQVLAMFSGYSVRTGTQRDGREQYLDVPVIYGDYSQVAAYLNTDGTTNFMSYLPVMSMYMVGMRLEKANIHNPQHVEKIDQQPDRRVRAAPHGLGPLVDRVDEVAFAAIQRLDHDRDPVPLRQGREQLQRRHVLLEAAAGGPAFG